MASGVVVAAASYPVLGIMGGLLALLIIPIVTAPTRARTSEEMAA